MTYYVHGSYPIQGSSGASANMRSELDAISTGFALLPQPHSSAPAIKGFNGAVLEGCTVAAEPTTNLGIASRNTAVAMAIALG